LGFLSFFVFSLGLGLPYLIFATFSGLLKKIPKAGSWLVWFEHVFGVILLGFSFYYFALAVDGEWLRWILPVAAVAGGLYLGFIDRAGQERPGFVRFKWSAGIIGMITGLAILASFFRQEPGRLAWEPYKLHKLYMAQQENKPVVIDFYADWCFTCHELEENVFRNPAVMETLSRFVRLRLDATDMESPPVQEALERYNIIGLPIVIFMGADGKEVKEARVIGLVSAEEFIQSMDLTLQKSESVNN
jgi:thiol:disulfide interchange protein DsbD